jgi:hypothetical protein
MGQFIIKLYPSQTWSDDPANSSKKPVYVGYYLIVNFNQLLFGNTVMGRIRVDFDEAGTGLLSLPENDEIQNNELSLEVYGASGNVVRQRFNRTSNSFYDDVDKIIEISVEPEQLDIINEVSLNYKVSGRLICLMLSVNLSDLQIVIFGNHSEELPTLQNSTILGLTKSYKDGYFQIEIPKSPTFMRYYAAIENTTIDFYPLTSIAINEQNFIEDKQIIAISFEEKIATENGVKIEKESDCGCHKNSDRLPSVNEFGNSENKYSQDLGGQCINFTVPNRTIDEFSFYHVVRTTEPEIKSVTISNAEILKIYENIVSDLNRIPPKLLLSSIPVTATFKEVTSFKSEIQTIIAPNPRRSTRAAAVLPISTSIASSIIRTKTPQIKYNLGDFVGLEATSFASLHEEVKTNVKTEFDKQKLKLEEDEANIIKLIERIKDSLEVIKLNLDGPESVGKFNDLKFQLDIINIGIDKYIDRCKEFKEFFQDELNNKIFSTPEVNYIAELDKTIEQFEIFETSISNVLEKLIRTYIVRHPGRKNVSIQDEIDWDSDPTLFHNTTIAHGHLLHFKQIWKNDGYSIGRVLQSIPLMPGQQKNIAVMEWNRTNISLRQEDQTTSEQLTNSMSRDRDVSEVMESAFAENIRASSQVNSKTSGWSIGASVGFPIGPVMVGVSGGYSSSRSNASSSASQNASRNLSANSMNKLRDNINQSATSMRSQRSTVIQTVSQNESFSVTTEVIANYNHCHALTMQYFEILRHIVIEQQLVDVQECLFVPLPMSVFNQNKILRWKNTLSGVLLQRDLREGLNAVDRMVNKYKFVDFPEGRYADENIDYIEGEMTISFNFVRPLDQIDEEGKEKFEALRVILENNPLYRMYGLFNTILNNYKQVALNLQKERDAIFENEIVPKIVDGLVNSLIIENAGIALPGFDFTLIDPYENKRISGWESLFKYANQGRFSEISSKNKPLRIRFKTTTPLGIKRSSMTSFEIKFDLNKVGLDGITAFPSENRIILHSVNAKYSTQHYNGILVSNYNIKDDIKPGTDDKASVRTPLNAEEKKNPKFEDAVLTSKLISHLNEYLEYYHKQIWLNMDPNRLFSLVDGFIAPHSGGKSVASVCDNQIIGVIGNNLVLKVAPGYKLDPTYNLTEAGNLLEHYQPTTPPDPFRICFPTNGIYAEAVMGACNSCEKIDDTRYWKWEEHPIPNKPTEIQPISTASRYVDPGNLQTKDLATPMINIQNAPEAPAPTGLGGVFDLMGKSGIFSDMTGLAGNQEIVKHALSENAKTLQNTQANAVEGMKVAKQIYDSQQANNNVQRKIEEIDKAFPPNGTPEQKAENARLKSALFNKQIGVEDSSSNGMNGDIGQAVNNLTKIDELVKAGKMSKDLGDTLNSSILSGITSKAKDQSKPTLRDAAVKASELGKKVEAKTTDITNGTTDEIKIEGQNDSLSAVLPEVWIDLEKLNPSMKNVFYPDKNDKSGVIDVEAVIYYAPQNVKYRWSLSNPNSGKIVSPNSPKTQIEAGMPGMALLEFEVLDSSDRILRHSTMRLGVPQFFVIVDSYYGYLNPYIGDDRVIENATTFDAVLNQLNLISDKAIIVDKLKQHTESRLIRKNINGTISGNNVRTLWMIGNNSEQVPPNILNPTNKAVNTLTTNDSFCNYISISGYPQGGNLLFGLTRPNTDNPTLPVGPRNFNEEIFIFTGLFELLSTIQTPTTPAASDVFEKVSKLIQERIANPNDAQLKDFMIEVFTRFYADVICHEIYHSIVYHTYNERLEVIDDGYDAGGHTLPPNKDILSSERNFMERTGIEVTDFANFPATGSYILHSFDNFSVLNEDNQSRADLFFPLPPL